jgi:hypothetical protein
MPTATGTQASVPDVAAFDRFVVSAVSPQTAMMASWKSTARPTSAAA